jgi:DNA polymerase I-like protein with 3'-5' exonuclease and polymerase domains
MEWKKHWWDKVQDTLFADHLLTSGAWHDLTNQAWRWLGVDIRELEEAIGNAAKEALKIIKSKFKDWRIARKDPPDPGLPSAKGEEKLWKWDMWAPRALAIETKAPPDSHWWTALQDYSTTDSAVTLPIWKAQKAALEERGLDKIYALRRKLIRIIYNMESRGVTVSRERMDEMFSQFSTETEEHGKACIALSGGKVEELPKNGTNKAMRELLFDDWKLPPLKHSDKTGVPSCDKDTLDYWLNTIPASKPQHRFVAHLKDKRKLDTSLSYMRSYRRYGIPLDWKSFFRLHPWLNATGSATLRFSSANPNEQNISKLDDYNIRYTFGPLPGREWWSLDYENLELRLPAYEANERVMIDLFEKPDAAPYFGSYHLLVCHILHPQLFEQCLRDGVSFKDRYKATWYQWTKNGNFAVQYGAQEYSGTADRAYHLPGAQAQIESRLTEIKKLSLQMIDFANDNGYVPTMPDREVGSYPIQTARGKWGKVSPTIPLSYHVQGTAMWCMCRAMVRCDEYLSELPNHFTIMQVHDELVFDFPKGRTPTANLPKVLKLKALMEESGKDIGVPLKVDYAYHPHNWAKKAPLDLGVAA